MGNDVDSYVRLLVRSDKIQYERLMKDSFGSAKGFFTRSEAFNWTAIDDFYPTLGLFDQGILKAVLRLEWIYSNYEFEIKFDVPKAPFEFNFPIGYIAKTATATDSQSKGFNLVLRYHALRIFDYWRVNAVTGAMVEGSPRVESMKKLGYYFFKKEKKWNGVFSSDRDVLISLLDGQERIQNAIAKIESTNLDLINGYQIQFSLSQVPMTGRINLKFPWDAKVQKPTG